MPPTASLSHAEWEQVESVCLSKQYVYKPETVRVTCGARRMMRDTLVCKYS